MQVNGKLRARISVAGGADEATLREAASPTPTCRSSSAAAAVRKVIVVPGKLVNVVV